MTDTLTRPTVTRSDLCEGLRACGIEAGDVLIVHASMKSLGYVEGGPAAVIAAMQDVLTPRGTLLMPTFAVPQPDGMFYVNSTPSRTGLLTETLRITPDVVRSWHPTHSVTAWGANAREWSVGHHLIGGLGVGSPFHRAAEAGAKVLMIGCDMCTCSLVHVAESIVRVPYLGNVYYNGSDRILTVVTPAGKHLTVRQIDPPTCSSGFSLVQREMEAAGQIRQVKLGAAPCLLFSGREALETAVRILRKDPAALLCHRTQCTVCPRARAYIASHS